MPRIVIYGAGGFGREMRRHALSATERNGFDGPVFADDASGADGGRLLGLPIITPHKFRPDDLCILAVGNGRARRRMSQRCPGFWTVIAETAVIDPGITFAEGSVICDQAIFTADENTVLGRHFHCNFQSYVGHDCVVGDFVTLGPRVGLNGAVHVGNDVYIGSGALIKNGSVDHPLVIGDGATIGFGSVVTKDVPPGATVVGNPAMPIRRTLTAVG